MSEKYINDIVDEIYKIVTSSGSWPNNFDIDQKVAILTNIQSFYESKDTHDGYARCAQIQRMIRILNVYKTKTMRSHLSGSNQNNITLN